MLFCKVQRKANNFIDPTIIYNKFLRNLLHWLKIKTFQKIIWIVTIFLMYFVPNIWSLFSSKSCSCINFIDLVSGKFHSAKVSNRWRSWLIFGPYAIIGLQRRKEHLVPAMSGIMTSCSSLLSQSACRSTSKDKGKKVGTDSTEESSTLLK